MVLVKHHLTGYTLKMNDKMYRTYSLYCLLSVFAAFASYRLHLEGFEKVVGDGLDAIINGTGRAPDQYRIFPYLVLAGMKESLSPWFGESWKYSILLFEALSLFGFALFLRGGGIIACYEWSYIPITTAIPFSNVRWCGFNRCIYTFNVEYFYIFLERGSLRFTPPVSADSGQ